jgi:hypothetical protein
MYADMNSSISSGEWANGPAVDRRVSSPTNNPDVFLSETRPQDGRKPYKPQLLPFQRGVLGHDVRLRGWLSAIVGADTYGRASHGQQCALSTATAPSSQSTIVRIQSSAEYEID